MHKRVAAVMMIIAALPAAALAASSEAQILGTQEEARQALLRTDVRKLDTLWGDEFTSITPSGQIRTKLQMLDAFKSGEIKYRSLSYDELKVRVYGNTAVMTGRARGAGVRNGVELPASPHGTRFTQVFVKRRGGWLLVAHQATTVAE